jgi:glycosyltransferase involved in cell wall biosynthesis
MDKVEDSMLAPGIVEKRVIPNGVNLSIFHPTDKRSARADVGIPRDAKVLLFVANGIRRNVWKDYQTLREAVSLVSNKLSVQPPLFIGLGEDLPTEHIGSTELRFVRHQKDLQTIARYYQAADIYIHAARADTFPNTVLEALACGTPVVATAVGGIPEQVNGAVLPFAVSSPRQKDDHPTGILVPERNASAMATAIETLLSNEPLRQAFGQNAAAYATRYCDLKLQAIAYLDFYRQAIANQTDRSLPR